MSGIVSCVCWVGKGVSKEVPDKLRLTKEELASLINNTGKTQPREEDGSSGEEEVKEEEEEEVVGNDQDVDDSAMEDDGGDKSSQEEDIEKLYDLKHYDLEEEDGPENMAGNIAGLSGLAYYASLDDDPYVTLKDVDPSDDEEEKEDFRILLTDNLLLVGRADEEISTVEVHVFSEADDHTYCHHEILVGEFPLVMEWLNFDPNQPEEYGNLVAIGTMSPVIEVWDLDLVDGPEPMYSLGTLPVKTKKLKKEKKKKKKKKKQEEAEASSEELNNTHTDSVLTLSWNTSVRSLLASGSADNTVKLWDLSELKCILTLPHPDKVQSLQWNRYEPQLLATGCYDGIVRLFNCETQTMLIQWTLGGEIEKVLWNHFESSQLLASTEDSRIFCLYKDSKAPVFTIHAHNQAVTDISLSCQVPGLLVTCSSDDTIKFWDIQDNSPVFLHTKDMHMGAVLSARFCVDNPYMLVVGGQKNGFNVLNVLSYKSLKDKCKEKGLLVPVEPQSSDQQHVVKVETDEIEYIGEDTSAMEIEPSAEAGKLHLAAAEEAKESSSCKKHKKKRKKKH